jgi:hypothetical protein
MKELFPDALDNAYVTRGCNVAVVDGPGQGEAIMRKIRITPDNFAPAMICAIHAVLEAARGSAAPTT